MIGCEGHSYAITLNRRSSVWEVGKEPVDFSCARDSSGAGTPSSRVLYRTLRAAVARLQEAVNAGQLEGSDLVTIQQMCSCCGAYRRDFIKHVWVSDLELLIATPPKPSSDGNVFGQFDTLRAAQREARETVLCRAESVMTEPCPGPDDDVWFEELSQAVEAERAASESYQAAVAGYRP